MTKRTNWKEILLSFIILAFLEKWIKETTKEKRWRYKGIKLIKAHLNSFKKYCLSNKWGYLIDICLLNIQA